VQSDDKTETSSGSADCGNAHPQCSGKGSCASSENAGSSTVSRSNNCHGQTRDEWYFPNGGFHYSCEARAKKGDGGDPKPSPGPLCRLTGVSIVCMIEDMLVKPSLATSSVKVSVIRGVAHGEVCMRDHPCQPIAPLCWTRPTGGLSCDTQPGHAPRDVLFLPVR